MNKKVRVRGNSTGAVVIAFGVIVLAILLNALWWIGSVAALVFGIVDTATVGVNGWAVMWVVVGAVGILLGLVGALKR